MPSRGGWGIGVAGPQALKTFFLRKGKCFGITYNSQIRTLNSSYS
jgi:hypothetical protein